MSSSHTHYQHENPYVRFLPSTTSTLHNSDDHLSTIKAKVTAKNFGGLVGDLRDYITLFGLKFSKEDHAYLVRYVYDVVCYKDVHPSTLSVAADLMVLLLKKKGMLSRKDLELPWKPLFQVYHHWNDSFAAKRGLANASSHLKTGIERVIKHSRQFFPAEATREMLDQWSPKLCPFVSAAMNMAMRYLALFLPTNCDNSISATNDNNIDHIDNNNNNNSKDDNSNSASLSRSVTLDLWFDQFMSLWNTHTNLPFWEAHLFQLLSRAAVDNMGQIDWEPHMEQIFVRLMNSLALPVTFGGSCLRKRAGLILWNSAPYYRLFGEMADWIVSVMRGCDDNSSNSSNNSDNSSHNNSNNNINKVQKYLNKMLQAIESFCLFVNETTASKGLTTFIAFLCTKFVKRVRKERSVKSEDRNLPLLREVDITNFVLSVKPLALHLVYGNHGNRDEILGSLATLRPHLIIPDLLSEYKLAFQTPSEPQRYISSLSSLSTTMRPMSENYKEQHKLTLLHILASERLSLNDVNRSLWNMWVTRLLLETISPEQSNSDSFREFATIFVDNILRQFIGNFYQEKTRQDSAAEQNYSSGDSHERQLIASVTSPFHQLILVSPPEVFTLILNKLISFTEGRLLPMWMAGEMVCGMLSSLVAVNPVPVLAHFVPSLCKQILSCLAERGADTKMVNAELQYLLLLLSGAVTVKYQPLPISVAKGGHNPLLPHLEQICTVLDVALSDSNRSEEVTSASGLLFYILKNLLMVRPIWKSEHLRMSSLPEFEMEWYIPEDSTELAAAQSLMDRYLTGPVERLEKLAAGEIKMEKEVVKKNLRKVCDIVQGCSEVLESLSSQSPSKLQFRGKPVRQEVLKVVNSVQKYLATSTPDDTNSAEFVIIAYRVLLTRFGYDYDNLDSNRSSFRQFKTSRQCKMDKELNIGTVHAYGASVQYEAHFSLHNRLKVNSESSEEDTVKRVLELAVSRYRHTRVQAQKLLKKIRGQVGPSLNKKLVPWLVDYLKQENPSKEMMKGVLHLVKEQELMSDWQDRKLLAPALIKAKHSNEASVIKVVKDISRLGMSTLPVNKSADGDDGDAATGLNKDYLEVEKTILELMEKKDLDKVEEEMAFSFLFDMISPANSKTLVATADAWLKGLVHDNAKIRKLSLGALICILKAGKAERKRIVVKVVQDYEWMQYKPDISKDKLREYWQMPFSVKPWLGGFKQQSPQSIELWVVEEEEKKVVEKEEKTGEEVKKEEKEKGEKEVEEKEAEEKKVDEKREKEVKEKEEREQKERKNGNMDKLFNMFKVKFEDQEYLDKFVLLNSTGRSFKEDNARLLRFMGENFGDRLLQQFMPHVAKLTESNKEGEQRLAAELVCGILAGSRFWTMDMADNLEVEMKPILSKVLKCAMKETLTIWEEGFRRLARKHDPNRLRWIFDFLMNKNLDSSSTTISTNINTSISINTDTTTSTSALEQCCHLRLLFAVLLCNFRLRELYTRAYETFLKSLDHEFSETRSLVANIMVIIMWDMGHNEKVPKVGNFIDEIIRRIEESEKDSNSNNGNDTNSTRSNSSNKSSSNTNNNITTSNKLLHTAALFVSHRVVLTPVGLEADYFRLLPLLTRQVDDNDADHTVRTACLSALRYLSTSVVSSSNTPIPDIITIIKNLFKSPTTTWRSKLQLLEFLQIFIFTNFMQISLKEDTVLQIKDLVLSLLSGDLDPRVRSKAGQVLSGLIHTGFIKEEDLLAKVFMKNKVAMGWCALVSAYPHSVPPFVPQALVTLCGLLTDAKWREAAGVAAVEAVRHCLREFRRTHADRWVGMHVCRFTEEQLEVVEGMLVSSSYYA